MKANCKPLATSLAAILQLFTIHSNLFTVHAAVPTEWTVRVGPRSAAYQAERRHGDALALKASLVYNGQPLAYSGPARLYAQTNGMGATWWDLAPCTVSSNNLQATWLPSFDTGADVVDLFLGGPSNYQAAARIRFLPSPGAVPNSLPLPVPVLDFAKVVVTNAPFATFDDLSAATDEVLQSALRADAQSLSQFASTGSVARAFSYGTPTRWTDATGCVWEVVTGAYADWHISTNGIPFKTVVWDDSLWGDGDTLMSYSAGDWYFSGPWIDGSYEGPEDILSFAVTTDIYSYGDFVEAEVEFARDAVYVYQTNLVGRVALTNDIPNVSVVAPSINAASGTAADAKATGTALFTGFTEWEFSGSGYDSTKNYWISAPVFFDDIPKYYLYEGESEIDGPATDDADPPVELHFTYTQITATRHLITPTKTSQLVNDGSNGVPFAVETQLGTKQDTLPYQTNAIPFAAISGAPTSPSVFYDAAGGAATVSGETLTYQAASNSVGSVALLAGTNILHLVVPAAISGRVRDFGLAVATEDAATITLDTSVSWRFDAASTNLEAGSWSRIYCTESPSGVFSLQLWTPDSAQEATP